MRPMDGLLTREIFDVAVHSASYIWSRNSCGSSRKDVGIVVSRFVAGVDTLGTFVVWSGTSLELVHAGISQRTKLRLHLCGSAVDICTSLLVTPAVLPAVRRPSAIATARAERGFTRDERVAARRTVAASFIGDKAIIPSRLGDF